jgi:hypothetical protein
MSMHLRALPTHYSYEEIQRLLARLGNRRRDIRVLEPDREIVSCRRFSRLLLLTATRYRMFAELLEHGTGLTLVLPIHTPTLPTPAAAPVGLTELDALRALGLNPANALQHPGFYYYMAAQATERRRAQFLSMVESLGETTFPGFVDGRKVDHFGIVVEVRNLGPVWHSTEYRVERSCTPKRTSHSRSTRHFPTDMARDD